MIVGELKPIDELLKMIDGYKSILIAGCKGCVTVCNTGGEKEVSILASALRMAGRKEGKPIMIDEITLERQCDHYFISSLRNLFEKKTYDAVLSIACSIGPQYIAEEFDDIIVLPGLNTVFMGGPVELGIWAEYCSACGECQIHNFGGLCPVTRCAKGLLNGPCGGSFNGKCEIDNTTDCVWELIYKRLKKLGQLDLLSEIVSPKDWSKSLSGGPRKMIREDLML